MKDRVKNKVISHIEKISDFYFKLIRLELDHFRLILLYEGLSIIGSSTKLHLTTSGSDEKINERRRLVKETFYSQKEEIIDSFFLTLAKIFDESKRNKPISLPNLVLLLTNSLHLFEEKKKIEQLLRNYKIKIEEVDDLLRMIKEHRDKCLAHSDEINKCEHLDGVTTNETRQIMDIVFHFLNECSDIFGIKKIEEFDIVGLTH